MSQLGCATNSGGGKVSWWMKIGGNRMEQDGTNQLMTCPELIEGSGVHPPVWYSEMAHPKGTTFHPLPV